MNFGLMIFFEYIFFSVAVISCLCVILYTHFMLALSISVSMCFCHSLGVQGNVPDAAKERGGGREHAAALSWWHAAHVEVAQDQ